MFLEMFLEMHEKKGFKALLPLRGCQVLATWIYGLPHNKNAAIVACYEYEECPDTQVLESPAWLNITSVQQQGLRRSQIQPIFEVTDSDWRGCQNYDVPDSAPAIPRQPPSHFMVSMGRS